MPKILDYIISCELQIPSDWSLDKFENHVKSNILKDKKSIIEYNGNKAYARKTFRMKRKRHKKISNIRNRIRSFINDPKNQGALYYSFDAFKYKTPGSAGYQNFENHLPRKINSLNQSVVDYRWNHNCVKFPEAINKITKQNIGFGRLNISKGHLATDIKIIQFDSGFSDHPSLIGNEGYLVSEAKSFVANNKSQSGKDLLEDYYLAKSSYQKPGHGSATAYTIIGIAGKEDHEWINPPAHLQSPIDSKLPDIESIRTENFGSGLFPYVKLIPYQVSNTVTMGGAFGRQFISNVGNPESLIKALDSAMDQGADIITMSMGASVLGSSLRKKINKAYREAYEKGIIMVCAAGNNKTADKFFGVVAPAEFPETIAVSAIEPRNPYPNDTNHTSRAIIPWPESCDGTEVDISAPGKYIFTTFKLDKSKIDPIDRGNYPDLQDGNLFKFGGATSQATAHVAAAAALWKFYYKEQLKDSFYYENGSYNSNVVEAFRYCLYKSKNTFSGQYGDWNDINNGPFSHKGEQKQGRKVSKRFWIKNYKGVLDVFNLINEDFGPHTNSCKKHIQDVKAKWKEEAFGPAVSASNKSKRGEKNKNIPYDIFYQTEVTNQ